MSNCTKCNDLGWVCEEHPREKRGHLLNSDGYEVKYCCGAGMPCTCDAFPHKKKPREFWIYEDNGDSWVSVINWNDQKSTGIHVREVIESPTDAEITAARLKWKPKSMMLDFEAGARWAIAKLAGGSK